MKKLTILVDQDHVVFDWGHRWDEHHDYHKPDGVPRSAEMKTWDFREGLGDDAVGWIDATMNHRDFYKKGRLIDGAKEALNEMLDAGHEVFIVTSPTLTNPTCASDKLAWIERELGSGWGKRTIITSDKTVIRGDILIDDKPGITGSMVPEWTQIIFDAPHNQGFNVGAPRLFNWSHWKTVVYSVGLNKLLLGSVIQGAGAWVAANKFGGPEDGIESYIPMSREAAEASAKRNVAIFTEAAARLTNPATGETRVTSSTGGQKGAKPERFDLIPTVPLRHLAHLYGNGAAKYEDRNWERGYAWSLSFAAAQRHLWLFWGGEDFDTEMQLPHLTCAAFHLFALTEFLTTHPEFDDRSRR